MDNRGVAGQVMTEVKDLGQKTGEQLVETGKYTDDREFLREAVALA